MEIFACCRHVMFIKPRWNVHVRKHTERNFYPDEIDDPVRTVLRRTLDWPM